MRNDLIELLALLVSVGYRSDAERGRKKDIVEHIGNRRSISGSKRSVCIDERKYRVVCFKQSFRVFCRGNVLGSKRANHAGTTAERIKSRSKRRKN